MIVFFLVFRLNFSSASGSEDGTLSEVSSYNFTDGFYNVVKYAETHNSDFRILHQTEIPTLNLSFTAPSDGYLSIKIIPINLPVPYITLSEEWESDGLHYTKNISNNETTYFVISPPLIFKDSNSSRVIGGEITIWELYVWPDLSGYIQYSFTPSDSINFEIIYYPSSPRQGDKINIFTTSNSNIQNITWHIVGEGIDWVNQSEILEVNSLSSGNYIISVTGFDFFKQKHIAQKLIQIIPPLIDKGYFDVRLFSVNYPESVPVGDSILINAIIDYSISDRTEVKCILTNLATDEDLDEKSYILEGSGSTNFKYNLNSVINGTMNFALKLFYKNEGKWIELNKERKSFAVNVFEKEEPNKFPIYIPIALIAGIAAIGAGYYYYKNKIIKEKENALVLS